MKRPASILTMTLPKPRKLPDICVENRILFKIHDLQRNFEYSHGLMCISDSHIVLY